MKCWAWLRDGEATSPAEPYPHPTGQKKKKKKKKHSPHDLIPSQSQRLLPFPPPPPPAKILANSGDALVRWTPSVNSLLPLYLFHHIEPPNRPPQCKPEHGIWEEL
jgi:hypothetical protein